MYKIVVTTSRDDIPNEPLGNDAKIGFGTCGCFGFLTITRDERIYFRLGFAICWQSIKGRKVYVVTFAKEVKDFTQGKRENLMGVLRTNNGFDTFGYLGNGHVGVE